MERGGRWGGGFECWYNIIKIEWPSPGSACYCLLNRKKIARKNSRADGASSLPPSMNFTKT